MSAPSEYKKPLPTPTAVSQPFGAAAKEHRLTFQRCRLCGTRVFYPRDICPGPECFGVGTLEWIESSGKGWVYASSISYQPAHPVFADDVPYVLAIIVGIDPKEVEIGMRVEVAWDDVTPEFSLPKFRP